MTEWKIYYNPSCSKSREAMALLEEKGIKPTVVEYLTAKPSLVELKRVATQLKLRAPDMIRKKEALYTELQLEGATDKDLFDAMSRFPELLERPIVLKGSSEGVIARPAEKCLGLFED